MFKDEFVQSTDRELDRELLSIFAEMRVQRAAALEGKDSAPVASDEFINQSNEFRSEDDEFTGFEQDGASREQPLITSPGQVVFVTTSKGYAEDKVSSIIQTNQAAPQSLISEPLLEDLERLAKKNRELFDHVAKK